MIYTVTFNPALDYVVTVNHFALGSVNRTVGEDIFYGGKGINVSAMLANLGYESRALGFVAGFTGQEIERGVKSLGFQSDFIHVKKGMSRINIKLKSHEESEINGMGPEVTPEDVGTLFKKLEKLEQGDVLVLSGSIPASIDHRIYEHIMEQLSGRGILTVVDGEKDLLVNVLKYHPFSIKPNNHELGQIFGTEPATDSEIVGYEGSLQALGAVNVLVYMAGEGAILVSGKGQVYQQAAPRGKVRNSVGAGDSMVAGFLAGYLEGGDWGYGLKLGTACGAATAFSRGIGSGELVRELFGRL